MSDTRNEKARTLFVSGLRDAHALENQALSIMNRQLERLEHYPDLSARLNAHVGETKGQIQRLESILDGLGESHSSMKDAAMSLTGNMAALAHTVAGDEVLKNSFADLAFENFEIASYKALLTMAEDGGFTSATSPLQATLREEEAMSGWLSENIPLITRRYMALYQSTGSDAKR